MSARASTEPLSRLRTYIGGLDLNLNDRLPPERTLCVELGLSRAALRKAMSTLAAEGQIWRQVGRGTFIGARPVLNLAEVRYLSSISSPAEIIDARLIIEPELARLAAMHGVKSDFAELRLYNRRCREARTWQMFEAWDNRFHFAIAATARNKLLMTIFETLNAVRRTLAWQTFRADRQPPAGYTTFAEHDAIVGAVMHHEPQHAAEAMRAHLVSVHTRLILRTDGRGNGDPLAGPKNTASRALTRRDRP